MRIQNIPIDKLIEYARNPRKNDAVVDKMVSCIKEFGFRIPIIAKSDGTVVDGHLRLKAARKMGLTEVPVVNADDLTEAQIKAFRLVANQSANWAEWDEELLKLEFKDLEDLNFDLELTGFDLEDIQRRLEELEAKDSETVEFENSEEEENILFKDPIAEAYIDKAFQNACGEILAQHKKLGGFSFYTPQIAKINFIKFLYYKANYNRSNSLAFHPIQVETKGSRGSLLDGLHSVFSGDTKVGSLRWFCSDKIEGILKVGMALGSNRLPLDFPANLARNLINEFAHEGKVLDPCSGWGGRLVGFLASEAVEYQGVDASPYQVEGDKAIYECFKDVVQKEKKVDIICSPFEKFEVKNNYYDMALTSPPYFNVEKYKGGEQSHQYENYSQWKEKFYTVLIKKVYESLRTNGVFCLQVGNQSYPLESDGVDIAKKIGFSHIESRLTDMVNTFNETNSESMERVVIFEKR